MITIGPQGETFFFTDHQDVKQHLRGNECLVLARRRVAASTSGYEFIKAFSKVSEAKRYAVRNHFNRDRYVMLLKITDSGLRNIVL